MKDFNPVFQIDRREFIRINALTGVGLLAAPPVWAGEEAMEWKPAELLEGLRTEAGGAPLENAVWYVAGKENAGCSIPSPKVRWRTRRTCRRTCWWTATGWPCS